MKFFHLSDLHIGLKLLGRDLMEDQVHILNQIAELARREQPDAILIAGDIYDKPVPSAEAVAAFDGFIASLAGAVPDAELMLVSGNHDAGSRALPELREALCACGYAITDERVVQDAGRNYVIIQAEPGKADYSQKQTVVGPVLLERMPPELLPYAQFRLRVAKKALSGAEASGDAAQIAPLAQEIEIWQEVLACLQR